MYRRLLLLLVAVAAIVSQQAQAQLLWKVTSPSSGKTSYLFGTHHVAPVTVLDSIAAFRPAFEQAEIIVGEMDMAQATSPAGQQTLALAGMAPADSTLNRVLAPEQLDSLGTMLTRYGGQGIPLEAFYGVKPALVSTMIAMAQAQAAFPDFDPGKQLDSYIQQQAVAAGKKVEGFETVEQQAAILFGSPIAEQAADLMKAIRLDDEAIEVSRRLASLYVKGDLDGILELMNDPSFGFSDAEADRMLYARNESWVKILASMLPTASVLVVVGAGHLGGPRGLISLLRSHGFDVTPL